LITTVYYDNANDKLYVGDWIGQIMFTTMADLSTFTTLDTSNVIPDTSLITDIDFIDTVMYVTTDGPGCLYRSYNNGYDFELIGQITDNHLGTFAQFANHTYAMGGGDSSLGGKIYYSSYYRNAYLNSSSLYVSDSALTVRADTDSIIVNYSANVPRFTSFTFKFRSDSNADMSSAIAWSSCPSVSNGTNIANISSVNAGDNYFQYRIEMTTAAKEITPEFSNVSLSFYQGLGIGENNKSLNIPFDYDEILGNVFRIDNLSNNNADIVLYSITGQKVFTHNIKNGVNRFNVDLPSGKYIMKIYSNNILLKKDNIYIIK